MHGGVYASLAESAASIGGATVAHGAGAGRPHGRGQQRDELPARRPAKAPLAIVATPLHRGRTLQLWQVVITDEQGRLVAKSEVRLANLAAERPSETALAGYSWCARRGAAVARPPVIPSRSRRRRATSPLSASAAGTSAPRMRRSAGDRRDPIHRDRREAEPGEEPVGLPRASVDGDPYVVDLAVGTPSWWRRRPAPGRPRPAANWRTTVRWDSTTAGAVASVLDVPIEHSTMPAKPLGVLGHEQSLIGIGESRRRSDPRRPHACVDGSDGIDTDRRGPAARSWSKRSSSEGTSPAFASRAVTVARRTPIPLFQATQLRTVTVLAYRQFRGRRT